MKANEMTHEQLADEMDSLDVDPARWEWKDGSHNEYYNRLNEAFEEATERLRTLTALEAKIKGMIERPTVEAFMLTPNAKGSSGLYVNEVWCGDLPNAEAYILVKRLTKALGMEGDK